MSESGEAECRGVMMIWYIKVIPRFSFHLWVALMERFSTKDRFMEMSVSQSNKVCTV